MMALGLRSSATKSRPVLKIVFFSILPQVAALKGFFPMEKLRLAAAQPLFH